MSEPLPACECGGSVHVACAQPRPLTREDARRFFAASISERKRQWSMSEQAAKAARRALRKAKR